MTDYISAFLFTRHVQKSLETLTFTQFIESYREKVTILTKKISLEGKKPLLIYGGQLGLSFVEKYVFNLAETQGIYWVKGLIGF